MKKTNNKVFSLVELIVVVAIMALLMVVLGPQLLRNVEKARIQRDNSAISEIANAAKIAMADETVNASIAAGASKTYTAASGAFDFSTDTDALTEELEVVIGAKVQLQASKYKASTTTKIIVAKDANGIVSVKGEGLFDQDGSAYGTDGKLTY